MSCYQELGQELARHGLDLRAVMRLALDDLLKDLPRLRELYNKHSLRQPSATYRTLRIIERELEDRMAMVKAQRSARYLSRIQGKGWTIPQMHERLRELKKQKKATQSVEDKSCSESATSANLNAEERRTPRG